MITAAQFDDWLRRYGRACSGGDPDAAAALRAPSEREA